MLNSMVYSVIRGSYELNKAYIIENFCVNKDKPMMNCDGKCYLAEQMKEAKEKRDANSTHKFSTDFGIYIAAPSLEQGFLATATQLHEAESAYVEPFTSFFFQEINKPPSA
ncbi:hypothetical protein GCM10009119_34970 [Algoriphagus jejuensis]|uniref:Uncharacterized protein n=2 Tax=Algoriphagus jejuensis TaxID=419934 RepID=A0ABP3YK70_9BACT